MVQQKDQTVLRIRKEGVIDSEVKEQLIYLNQRDEAFSFVSLL